MTLLVSVLGVFAAAAVVRSAARSVVPGERPPVSWAAGIAAVVTVLGVFAMANNARVGIHDFRLQHATNVAMPRTQLNGAGGAVFGTREDFMAWADGRMPRRARVFLKCTPTCGGIEQWVTWRLLPRPFVDRLQDADWVLLYNAVPKDVGLRASDPRVVKFDKRLYLAPVPR